MGMVDKTVEGGEWPMTPLDPLSSPDSMERISFLIHN